LEVLKRLFKGEFPDVLGKISLRQKITKTQETL
jgi:hypothetical protein